MLFIFGGALVNKSLNNLIFQGCYFDILKYSDLRSSFSDDSDKKGRSVKHSAKHSSPTSSGVEELEHEKEACALKCMKESSDMEPRLFETRQMVTVEGDDDSDGEDPLEHTLGKCNIDASLLSAEMRV